MENLSHSRHPNRSLPSLPKKACNGNTGKGPTTGYDDVFGGPPRFVAPTLSPRHEDYCEIFGGFNGTSRAAVSSIPVLDLPLVDDRDVYFDVRSPGFDYSEVFGGFDDPDFAPLYEELLMERAEVGDGDSSDDAWTPAETESISGGTEHSGKSPCFSNGRDSYESIDGSTEFNISYNRSGQISYTNMSNGVIHVADLSAVPGYTFPVDEMAYAGGTTKLKKKTQSFLVRGDTSSYTFGNDEKTQNRYSRAVSFPSETFVTISDVNLKTQPSEVPPPSRPPPQLKRDSSSSASNSRTAASEGSVDCNSPPFFDVDGDASSAAVKEAMEKAQARLKSAKEILERKKDGLRITVKPSPANERMSEEGKLSHSIMKLPTGLPEFEKNVNAAIKSSEDKPGRKSLPLQGSAKFNGNDEWKEATQFFELVRTEKPRNADESSSGNDISLRNNAEFPEQKQKWAVKGDIEKQKERRAKGDKGDHEVEKLSGNYGTTKVAFGHERHEKERLAEKVLQDGMEEESRNVVPHVEAENKLSDHGGSEMQENLVKSEQEGNRLLVDKRAKQKKELHCEETKEDVENKESDIIKTHPRKAVEQKQEYVFEWEQSARKLREALGLADNESMLEVSLEPIEDGKKSRMADGMDENEKKLKEALERMENGYMMKESREKEEKESRVREALEKAENEKRLKAALEQEEKERTLKEARGREEHERRMKEALEQAEQEKRMKEQEEKERRLKEAFEKEEKNQRLKEVHEKAEHERKLKLAQDEKERQIKEACEKEERERKIKEDREKAELERRQKEALEQEQKERQLKEVQEREENERRAKEAFEEAVNERRLKEALEQAERERRLKQEQEENEKKLKEAIELEEKERKLRETLERAESDRRLKEALEQEELARRQIAAKEREESENKEKQHDCTREDNKERLEEVLERGENNESQREACEREKTSENHKEASGKELLQESPGETKREDDKGDNNETLNEVPAEVDEAGQKETGDMAEKTCPWKDFEKKLKDASRKEGLGVSDAKRGSFERNEEVTQLGKDGGGYQLNGEKLESTKPASVMEAKVGPRAAVEDGKKTSHRAATEEERVRNTAKYGVGCDERNLEESKYTSRMFCDLGTTESKFSRQQEERGSSYQTLAGLNKDVKLEKPLPSRVARDFVDTTRKEAVQNSASQTTGNKSRNLDEILAQREKEVERIKRERELQMERLRKIEEEREREREREKDRMAFDQRALADARERLEKACIEAREKSLTDKLSTEARLRAERAAVERVTAEARERAAEKAALEARERMERLVPDKQFQSSASFGATRYQSSSAYAGADGESPQRYISRLERHRRTADRVAKALAEKNMRDLVAQREQAERNRLAETLDAEVKRWSSGKEGNIRALLSTLQYILGPESGWQPLPLTEVITSAAVKKAYRKATLCVHPDKLQQRGASIQQKYICEKVFDLLKEAWSRFNSEER